MSEPGLRNSMLGGGAALCLVGCVEEMLVSTLYRLAVPSSKEQPKIVSQCG